MLKVVMRSTSFSKRFIVKFKFYLLSPGIEKPKERKIPQNMSQTFTSYKEPKELTVSAEMKDKTTSHNR